MLRYRFLSVVSTWELNVTNTDISNKRIIREFIYLSTTDFSLLNIIINPSLLQQDFLGNKRSTKQSSRKISGKSFNTQSILLLANCVRRTSTKYVSCFTGEEAKQFIRVSNDNTHSCIESRCFPHFDSFDNIWTMFSLTKISFPFRSRVLTVYIRFRFPESWQTFHSFSGLFNQSIDRLILLIDRFCNNIS